MMCLPLAVSNLLAKVDHITIVSDNARAPGNPQSFSMDSPPLVRACGRRHRKYRCRTKRESAIGQVIECRNEKPMIEAVNLVDAYMHHTIVQRTADSTCTRSQPKQNRELATITSRILSEALKTTTD